jgi:hypothetical protein
MPNPLQRKDEIDFLLVGVSVVIGLIVVVIIYYVYTYTSSSSVSKQDATEITQIKEEDEYIKESQKKMFQDNTTGNSQVFNIADNVFSYDDAEAVCRAYGAELADYTQMVDAYKNGANWCNYGWTKGQLALYPIQPEFWNKMQETDDDNKRGACGVPGINGGYFENKNLQFGVNCYGSKRAPQGDERIKNVFVSDKEREIQQKVINFRKQLGNFKLTPFNENTWSG